MYPFTQVQAKGCGVRVKLAAAAIWFVLTSLPSASLAQDPRGGQPYVRPSEQYWEALRGSLEAASKLNVRRQGVGSGATQLSMDVPDISNFPSIQFFASVSGNNGAPIEGLKKENFLVIEDEQVIREFNLSTVTGTRADIVFVMDTTGSMSRVIAGVRDAAQTFADVLSSRGVDARFALVTFGDEVRQQFEFTGDVNTFKRWVASQSAEGGRDLPENPLDALIAASQMSWRTGAQRIVILTADSPPHTRDEGEESPTRNSVSDAIIALSNVGVKVYYWVGDYDFNLSELQPVYDLLGEWVGTTTTDFSIVINRIGSAVVTRYLFSYVSPNPARDGTLRAVRASVVGTTAQGRQTYRAPVDEPTGTLSGVVTDTTGKPIADATIRVLRRPPDDRLIASLTTSTEGTYNASVPAGDYVVHVSKPGYDRQQQELGVVASTATTANFTLKGLDLFQQMQSVINALKAKRLTADFVNPDNPSELLSATPEYAEVEQRAQRFLDEVKRIVGDPSVSNEVKEVKLEALFRDWLAHQVVLEGHEDASDMSNLAADGIGEVFGVVAQYLGLTVALDSFIRTHFPDQVPVLGIPIDLTHAKDHVSNLLQKAAQSFYNAAVDTVAMWLSDEPLIGDVSLSSPRKVFIIFAKAFGAKFFDRPGRPGKGDPGGGGQELIAGLVATLLEQPLLALHRLQVRPTLSKAQDLAERWSTANETAKVSDEARVWSQIRAMQDQTATDRRKTELAFTVRNVASIAKQVSDGASFVFAATGIGGALAAVTRFIAKASEIVSILSNVGGTTISLNRLYFTLPPDINKGAGAAFGVSLLRPAPTLKRSYVLSPKLQSLGLSSFEQAVSAYNEVMSQIISAAEAKDANTLVTLVVNQLPAADEALNSETKAAAGMVLGGAQTAIGHIPGFDAQFNLFAQNLLDSQVQRAILYAKLLQLLYDSSNPDVVTTTVVQARTVMQTHTQLLRAMGSATSTLFANRVASPPLLVIKSVTLPDFSNGQTEGTVTATIRNVGGGAVTDVTARLERMGVSDVAIASASEQPVGLLQAGEERIVSWSVRITPLTHQARVLGSVEPITVAGGLRISVTSPDAQLSPDTMVFLARDGRLARVTLPRGLSLVSFPLRPYRPEASEVFSNLPLKAARWEAREARYRFFPDESFAVSLGGGFWVKNETETILAVPGRVPTREGTLPIPLTVGWNLLGNPWDSDIGWLLNQTKVRRGNEEKTLREAQAAGWLEDFLWGWRQDANDPNKGSYYLVYDSSIIPGVANVMEPWKGYWIKANVECDLILPPPSGAMASRALTRRKASSSDWLATLSAEAGGAKDSVSFGASAVGRSGGKLQIGKPPAAPGQGNLEVFFVPADRAATVTERLGVDVRRSVAAKEEWHLVVRGAQPNQDVTLRWEDLGKAPRPLRFRLIDEATGARRYMRTTSAYTFRAGAAGEERRFRIEVETASAQGKLLAHLNAVNNGAQGGAHFSFVLSQPATVNARIITPTGKVAAVVARGVEGKQGLNTFTWNGKTASGASLPRGVYLVEVEAVTDEGQVVKDVRTFALR